MSGGSKSSGGSSGKVDYPNYMKNWHSDGLGSWSTMSTVSSLMSTAMGSSPFTGASAYDPSTEIDAIIIAATNQLSKVDEVSFTALDGLSAYVDGLDTIGEVVDLEDTIIPRFETGMLDVNAVQSSAFIQGKANLEASYAARLASFKAELKTKVVSDSVQQKINHVQVRGMATAAIIEANRMAIVAYTEEAAENLKYDEADVLWDLEIVKYGGNFLGSIGGTAVNQGTQSDKKQANPLGGALSGAAMGATVGSAVPGIGTGVGAVVGGAIGLLASL